MKELSIEETKEIWKQIEEEDFNSYSVSNLGRIKNRKGKILKPQLICGYLYCILRRKNGKNTSRRINNVRTNVHLTLNGVTHTMSEWSRLLNINWNTLHTRHYKGWSDEKILTTPVRHMNKKEK